MREKIKLESRNPRELELRICIRCNKEKETYKFNSYIHTKTNLKYYKNVCNHCKTRQTTLKYKYGITQDDYNRMLEEQEGHCYICPSTSSQNLNNEYFDIDHDHKTGKVRGLLCHKCNKALGFFQDNIEIMENALVYLKHFQ